MSDYPAPSAAEEFRAALLPLSLYCDQEHERLDPHNPAHNFRFRHVHQLEQALEAAAAYARAAEELLAAAGQRATATAARAQDEADFWREAHDASSQLATRLTDLLLTRVAAATPTPA